MKLCGSGAARKVAKILKFLRKEREEKIIKGKGRNKKEGRKEGSRKREKGANKGNLFQSVTVSSDS